MKNKVENLKEISEKAILEIQTLEELEKVRLDLLGKKGKVNDLMMALKELPNDQKREAGQLINGFKKYVEDSLASKKLDLQNKELENKVNNIPFIDITLPVEPCNENLHPITMVTKELIDIFVSMGFGVEDGREIESEFNNFEAVNVPKNHPARDMQDTFWLETGEVLKTHTSAAQNRILRKYGAPCKVIFPGRCFRNESVDASHDNTFFQLEGMVVGEDISISNLIYFMKTMLSKAFKQDIDVRLRPGFFPFVEPGFELDASCIFCGGKGCPTCKNGGWIELCPCGMIHPKVLEMGGIDSKKYQGFAFGLGLTRLAMMKYGISDIRYTNTMNLKFLKQKNVK
ncbi:MAG: phenylalanine--tRNA ligase subunit alpha [Clostridia bacterium]|nr:phenylalanine--tRNA ligase subunit alpha [Clostridia bacterium]